MTGRHPNNKDRAHWTGDDGSPSPSFDAWEWADVQDFGPYIVAGAFVLGIAYAYGRAMGGDGVAAVLAGLIPAYLTGKALAWLWRRTHDALASLDARYRSWRCQRKEARWRKRPPPLAQRRNPRSAVPHPFTLEDTTWWERHHAR